ncbi:MAG TPA: DUF6508 domain-containing protein [Atopostipes sp.]|nr:DUF6508 domain-containing protein [Atopostipes sp.]
MAQYEALTKYIPLIEEDYKGEWVEHSGKSEKTFYMPYIKYSDITHLFMRAFYRFIKERKDLNVHEYRRILEKNNIEYSKQSILNAEVSSMDAQCVLALILTILRLDRFTQGTLLYCLREGYITKWLNRLKELDEC